MRQRSVACFCSMATLQYRLLLLKSLGQLLTIPSLFASTAFGAFVVAVVLALTPTWIGSRCCTDVTRQTTFWTPFQVGTRAGTPRALLADAKQASTSLRVRVSFTLLQVGLLGLSITGPPFVLGSFMLISIQSSVAERGSSSLSHSASQRCPLAYSLSTRLPFVLRSLLLSFLHPARVPQRVGSRWRPLDWRSVVHHGGQPFSHGLLHTSYRSAISCYSLQLLLRPSIAWSPRGSFGASGSPSEFGQVWASATYYIPGSVALTLMYSPTILTRRGARSLHWLPRLRHDLDTCQPRPRPPLARLIRGKGSNSSRRPP